MPDGYDFLKGHGTENDFVLLPDHDGSVHGDLAVARVRALCDRWAGLGADGVLRVIRTNVIDPPQDVAAEWFMDYRNADGGLSEMCGNGIRLFALHLAQEGLVDPSAPVPIATRDGIKTVTLEGDAITVDLGHPHDLGETTVGVSAAAQLLPLADLADLDSAGLMASDIASGVRVGPDGVALPDGPGIGADIDWDVVHQHHLAPWKGGRR